MYPRKCLLTDLNKFQSFSITLSESVTQQPVLRFPEMRVAFCQIECGFSGGPYYLHVPYDVCQPEVRYSMLFPAEKIAVPSLPEVFFGDFKSILSVCHNF